MKLSRKKFDRNEVRASGSDNPKLYFVLNLPGEEDSRTGKSLNSKSRIIAKKILKESRINEVVPLKEMRFKTALAYRPIRTDFNTYETLTRYPSREEVQQQSELLLADIRESNPEIIVCCGKYSKQVLGFENYMTGTFSEFEGKLVYFMSDIADPLFISTEKMRRNSISRLTGEVVRLKNKLNGFDINDLERDLDYKCLNGFNLDELRHLEELFESDEKLVLDYETSGFDPYSPDFHLAGIGLSSLDSKRTVYITYYHYANRKSHDNPVPKECNDYIAEFFRKKKFVVYNMQYECAVTSSASVGIEYNLEHVEDVLMALRCMAKGSSLKDACINRLGAKNWSEDIKEWIDYVSAWMKLEKPTSKMKGHRKEVEWLLTQPEKDIFALRDYQEQCHYIEVLKDLKRLAKGDAGKVISTILAEESLNKVKEYAETNGKRLRSAKEKEGIIKEIKEECIFNDLKYEKAKEGFLKKKDITLLGLLDKFQTLFDKYFNGNAPEGFQDYLVDRLLTHGSQDSVSYAEVPLEIVAPYCALDCKYTAMLYPNVMEEVAERGLEKTVEYYNQHAYLGYILSRNGIAWDDDLAKFLKKDYSESQIETLRSLIGLPKIREVLRLNNQQILQAKATTDLDELKSLFNPMSSHPYPDITKTTKYRISHAIMSTRFKLGCILYEAFEHSKQLSNPEDAVKSFPIFYPIYKEIIKIDGTSRRLDFLEVMLEDGEEIKRQLLESQKDRKNSKDKNYSQEVDLFRKYIDYKVESMDQEATSRLYLIFKEILDIDPDNDSEWPEEFAALYFFKIFKKIDKSLGTYIEGEIGRQSVQIIRKSDASLPAPQRVATYERRDKKDDEVYLLKTSWGVCTAVTKRWTAAQHTVPKKTELMDLRTSRYPDGIKVHYDFSQAEVRVLAAMSGDETLLRAYEEGLDVHRLNASIMWEKPMDQVTDDERSMAKGVTFSILYGASVAEFANKYTKGNVHEASEIISSFFKKYKKVDQFIKDCHRHGAKNGWVASLMGDPIYVDTPFWFSLLSDSEQDKLIENPYNFDVLIPGVISGTDDERKERSKLASSLRYSQNYPIQETSSMLSGLSIYQLQKLIEQKRLSTKIECFTHDSCDTDNRVKDILTLVGLLDVACVEYIKREFGVPMKIDIEMGISNNKMMELKNIDIKDTTLNCHFSGTKTSLNSLCERLMTNGVDVNYSLDDEEEKILSSERLFLTKSAYASAIGKPYVELSGDISMRF